MGQTLGVDSFTSVTMSNDELRVNPDDFPNNGLILNDIYLPDEIVTYILSFVRPKDLLNNCTYVCRQWALLIKQEVWKVKAERDYLHKFANVKPYRRLPDLVYQSMCCRVGYNNNLLDNNTGQTKLKSWRIVHNEGNRWKVETPPVGVVKPENSQYDDPTHCFVTSYSMCRKSQTIDLIKKGIHPTILDNYQPDILVSEWCSARWDCNSYYSIQVVLLDENKAELKRFEEEVFMTDWLSGWKVVSHKFENYGPGVRYIEFIHSGHDLRFWAGHYGSKMANASVIVDISNLKSIHDDSHISE